MNRHALLTIAAAAAVAGCGTRTPVWSSGDLPQSNAIAQHRSRGLSWLLKEPASQELVYVSEQGEYNDPGVYVYSYPQGKQVGFLQDSAEVYEGLCADTHGNVWVVGWGTNRQAFYTEYAHGGSQPVQEIIFEGDPSGCSVDPSTGNLAVANYLDYDIPGHRGDVAVWRPGSSEPTDYYDNSITYYYYCAYDDKGNLYADGNANYINVLNKGRSTLRHVYFAKPITPGSLQWNAGSLAVALVGGAKGPVHVDRVMVQGSSAHITGTTSLQTSPRWGNYLNVQFWIHGKAIAGVGPGNGGPVRALYFWPYPTGGKASETIQAPSDGNFYGVAISPRP